MKQNQISISPTFPSMDGSIFLPASLMRRLGIREGQNHLAFGTKRLQVEVWPLLRGSEPDVMLASRDVVEALHLPCSTPLTFFRKGSNLRFGYLFGLMADFEQTNSRIVGLKRPVIKQTLLEAEKQGMFAYVFSPLDVDFENGIVQGYRPEQGGWKSMSVPLPDVMYDRISSRTFAGRPHAAAKIGKLYQLLGNRFFNKGYFHKWQMHKWLSMESKTNSYVPETIHFDSIEAAVAFLKHHGDLYIKPSQGALGAGIIRAKYASDGRVYFHERSGDGTLRKGMAVSADAFFKKKKQHLQRGQYILQRTLKLMTWKERPFDIRLLIQKDGDGEWQRTKLFCRMAQAGDLTNNISAGAVAMEVDEVLQDILQNRRQVKQAIDRLEQVAADVAELLERRVSSSIGELGFDFAFDQEGNVWVIEVNAKPMKRQNATDGANGERNQLAFERCVQYAYHLCETDKDL